MSSTPLALICAVPFEAEALSAVLRNAEPIRVGHKAAISGQLDGVPVVLLTAGMGKANAAQALTALLETREVHGVIGFGIAGAYPGSSLKTGRVALASAEIYGDEGVEAPGGWLGTDEIGIPLLERTGLERFNIFPLPAGRVEAARCALETAGIRVAAGPFVTVSCCSGTQARGAELAARWGAICETMEGAALTHICELYTMPFLEVRGISNAVEDRDLSRWRLREAADAAARAVRVLVREWGEVQNAK